MDLPVGTDIDGRYVIGGPLGQGGMARVYRAQDTKLDVDVAVKVLTVSNPGFRERLLREGRVQAALRHPNIVNVSDIVSVQGFPALVMERVRGAPLDALLAGHPLDAVEAEWIARGILAGLRAAHEHQVVHRDLKPANVLVARSGDSLLPKVADFGLVKLVGELSDSKTRSGASMGTPRYMAPEQVRDAKDVDVRADLWSFGAVLYELLCGRPPFDGSDTYEIYNAVVEGRYDPPDVPERLRRVIEGCLSVDRDRRPASAVEVQGLLDADGGGPPEAWRPSTLDALRRLEDQASAGAPAVQQDTSSETWTGSLGDALEDDGPSAPTFAPEPTFPETPLRPSPPPSSYAGPAWTVFAFCVVAALALWWMLAAGPQGFTVSTTPQVDHATYQNMLDQAWLAYQANEDSAALDKVKQAVREGATDPAFYLLGAAAELGFMNNAGYHAFIRDGARVAVPGRSAVDDLLVALEEHHDDPDTHWWKPVLESHLEEHPDDWLARTMLASAGINYGLDLSTTFYEDLETRNPAAPQSDMLLIVWLTRHDPDRVLAETERAVAEHPTNGSLLVVHSRALLDKGDEEGALRFAERCLAEESDHIYCRYAGIQASLRLGDEATTQRLLAPMLLPDADTRDWALVQGVPRAMQDVGRHRDADELWERTIQAAAAESSGMLVQAEVTRLMSLAPRMVRTTDELDAQVDRVKDALVKDGLEANLLTWAKNHARLQDGVVAAERGDLNEARSRLDEVRGPDRPMLKAAIAWAEEDWETLAVPPSGEQSGCVLLAQVWWLLDLQQPTEALRLLSSSEPGACGTWRGRAIYEGMLALALARTGDRDGAEDAVDRLRAYWRQPDPDLPIIRELAATVTPNLFDPGALTRWLSARDEPLLVGLGPLDSAGTDGDEVEAVRTRLLRLLDDADARVLPVDRDTEAVDVVITGQLGRLGKDVSLNLVVDRAGGGERIGAARVDADSQEALAGSLEGALLVALTGDASRAYQGDVRSVLQRVKPALKVCLESHEVEPPLELRARMTVLETGRLTQVDVEPDRDVPVVFLDCVKELLAEQLLPVGFNGTIAYPFIYRAAE